MLISSRILGKAFAVAGLCLLVLAAASSSKEASQAKPLRAVHVFVALCDNASQGIVPVPPRLGNGDDPARNLYWGALYGVKTHFAKSKDWKLVATVAKPSKAVLERCIFANQSGNVYLVADAYRGSEIKQAVKDFLNAGHGKGREEIALPGSVGVKLTAGGGADLVAYVGHDGLMDFSVNEGFKKADERKRDAIVLACLSRSYFGPHLKGSGAYPLLWTTGLMAPEAYTLAAALDGWMKGETPEQVRERAAKAYDKYQKCGLGAAKRLLVTGW